MSELLTRTRAVMRLKHYSYKTEKIYVYWMKKYFYFHDLKHPKELSAAEIEEFLTFLAVEQKVSASTQNQALAAILFLYREVLQINLPWLEKFTPAKKSNHLPVVMTKEEVNLNLSELKGTNWIISNLLYGSGLRLTEALRLRVKDLEFSYKQIIVRGGKGGKDRVTVLPEKMIEPLKRQLTAARKIHDNGQNIRTIQDLLGHKEISTTMIYTHVLQNNRLGGKSPVDL